MEATIKFRFWNTRSKKISNPISLWEIPFVFDKGIGDNFIPMIFTGMLDKNGIEIYDGDFVQIDRYGEKIKGEVTQLPGGQYYINHDNVSLKYQHQIHCEVCDTDSPVFFLNFFDAYELEVIGNRYSNY